MILYVPHILVEAMQVLVFLHFMPIVNQSKSDDVRDWYSQSNMFVIKKRKSCGKTSSFSSPTVYNWVKSSLFTVQRFSLWIQDGHKRCSLHEENGAEPLDNIMHYRTIVPLVKLLTNRVNECSSLQTLISDEIISRLKTTTHNLGLRAVTRGSGSVLNGLEVWRGCYLSEKTEQWLNEVHTLVCDEPSARWCYRYITPLDWLGFLFFFSERKSKWNSFIMSERWVLLFKKCLHFGVKKSAHWNCSGFILCRGKNPLLHLHMCIWWGT